MGEGKRFVFAVTMRSRRENEWEAAFATPTNTLLEPGIIIKSDENQILAVPFIQCGRERCAATIEIDRALLEKMLKAGKLTASYQTATGQAFTVTISTRGLPQGLAALRG
jgi:invasion protein IalB